MTDADNIFFEARHYEEAGEHRKAFALYCAAAEMGCVSAYSCAGYACLYGQGTEIDYQKAVEYFRRGEAENNANCICNLGFCYSKGYGVPQNTQMAMALYMRATKAGSKQARQNYIDLLKEILAADPDSGYPILYGVSEKMKDHLHVTADLILVGEEDGVTVLPILLPDYGIDIRIPFHNSISEYEMITVKNVPSFTRPEKPYMLSIMVVKTRRIPGKTDDIPDQKLRGAQWLKDYYESHSMQPEAFGDLRLYGPAEMAPGHLLAAAEMSFTGTFGTTVPIQLPSCGIEVTVGLHYKLEKNQPFVLKDLVDKAGNPCDLTVIPVAVIHQTGGSSAYAMKRMREVDPKEYVKKLTRRQIKMLAGVDSLEKAAVELYLDSTFEIGEKALVSEHFLFHKRRRGFVIPCQDILWFFDDAKGRFYVGTRTRGILKVSRCRKTGTAYQTAFKHYIHYLRERTDDLLVGNTIENAAEYERRRN